MIKTKFDLKHLKPQVSPTKSFSVLVRPFFTLHLAQWKKYPATTASIQSKVYDTICMQLALCGRHRPLFCKIWLVVVVVFLRHNETQPFCIDTLCLTTVCCLQTKAFKLAETNNLHVCAHAQTHNDYNPLRQVLFRAAAT